MVDDVYMLDVSGGCMEPDLHDGSRILVSAIERPRIGDYVVYRHMRDGRCHAGRVMASDGFYYRIANNEGMVCNMTEDMVEAVAVAVVGSDDMLYRKG